jgi:hypothetical protein
VYAYLWYISRFDVPLAVIVLEVRVVQSLHDVNKKVKYGILAYEYKTILHAR